MARWQGGDSEYDVEGRYQEWVLPVEVLEDLWAAAGKSKFFKRPVRGILKNSKQTIEVGWASVVREPLRRTAYAQQRKV